MPARQESPKPDAEEPLPVVHRTVHLPPDLWEAVKAKGTKQRKSVRWVIAGALDKELLPLTKKLRKIGLRGEVKARLVRLPLDDNSIGRLNLARRETGLAAVEILRLCLLKYVSGRKCSRGPGH